MDEIHTQKLVTPGERDRWIKRRMNYYKPQIEKTKDHMKKFSPAYCELTGWIDYLGDRFDLFILEDCPHLLHANESYDYENDESSSSMINASYAEVMRQIQTFSAIIFFVLVHIPLSRINSGFQFISCLLPMMLNLKTKYWFYEKTNRFMIKFFPNDMEAKNYVQKPKEFRDDKDVNIEEEPTDIYLSNEEQSGQENAAYALVVYLSLFFSLLFNYVYNVFLQEIVVSDIDFIYYDLILF